MKANQLITSATLALAALFAANTAIADGWSLGLSGARAPVGFKSTGTTYDGDSTGYRIFGSYMFNKNFGIEAGISKYGEPNDSTLPSNMHVDTEAYDVYAVAAMPVGENLGLIAKAGFASFNTETEVNDDNETHYRSTDFGLSFGGQYDFSETFALRGELEWFDSIASGSVKYSLSGVIMFD